MQWYYADAGRQVGPLDDAAFEDLVRSGVIQDETPIWREGLADWQPYSTVRPARPAPPPPAPIAPPAPVETAFCTQCGGRFPTTQLAMVGNRQMCPGCRQAAYAPPAAAAPAYSAGPAAAGGFAPGPSSAPGIPAATPLTQFATPVAGDYATWANRVLGYLIDSVFVFIAMIILGILGSLVFGSMIGLGSLGASGPDLGVLQGIGGGGCCFMLALMPLATLGVGLYNKVYLLSQRGFSIGQGVMKIKIVDAQGNKLSFGTAFIRLLAQAGLSLIPGGGIVDLLWPLWDAQRQTLHDKAVGSFAINNPSGR